MNLLQLIKLLFGPRAMSKTLGTRTNVIRLPDKKMQRYIKEDLNIEAASDDLAKKAYKDMEQLIAEVPRMNDAERLIFEGNLRRLKNKLKIKDPSDPTAEVIEFGTKEKVSPKGIETLVEQAGQKSPPGTLMGNLESRINKLKASGEDLSKMKGQTLDDIIGDVASSQQGMRQLQREGLVRATARDIITSDIKSGKLKLPKELQQQILEGGGEPIDILRNVYGEDALEVLDSLIPEFSKLKTSTEAEKLARSKFKFEPNVNRPKGSMTPEEAAKAEQTQKIIPADSPEGKKITEKLIGKPKASVTELITADKVIQDMTKMDPMDAMKEANKVLKKEGRYKNLKEDDVKRIMDETNDHIFGRNLPEDEGFATGGRVGYSGGGMSKGLDYLTGIERRGYANGNDLAIEELIQRMLIKNPNILIENAGGGNEETITPSYSNRFMGNPQAKSMYTSPYSIGLGDIFGGITNIAAKAMGYPNVGYALGALIGLGKGGLGMSYGASNRSGAVDTGDTGLGDTSIAGMGYSAAYGNAEASEGAESPGGDNSNASDPGGSDTEGSFAQGGRVKYLKGGLSYLMGL